MNISQHIKHSVNYFLNSFTFSSTLLSDSPRSVGSGPFYGPFRRDELEWGQLPHFEDLPAGFGTARPQKRWDVAFQTSSCKFQVNCHCQNQVYLEVDVYSVFVIFYSYFYFLHFEWQWKSSWKLPSNFSNEFAWVPPIYIVVKS